MTGPHETLFTAALDQLPEGVILVDGDDRIVYANRKAQEVRNVKSSDILGGDVRDCHQAKSAERVERALNYVRATGEAVFTRMVVDNVSEKTYENTYAGLVDDDGEYLGLLLLTRDVTDRLELERARAVHIQALSYEVERLNQELHELFMASMVTLVRVLEAKDPYTKGHSERVSEMAQIMAQHMWGAVPETSALALAGRLHDIGKVAIRTEVLNKPGALEDDEWAHVQTHPIVGERILSPIVRLSNVIDAIRHHHERFDGKGYPDSLTGDSIPEWARVIAIADAYDAMTSNRLFMELFETGTIG